MSSIKWCYINNAMEQEPCVRYLCILKVLLVDSERRTLHVCEFLCNKGR